MFFMPQKDAVNLVTAIPRNQLLLMAANDDESDEIDF